MRVTWFALLSVAAASCLPVRATAPRIVEYRLAYEPPGAGSPPLPATLRIESFGIAPVYDRQAMLLRHDAYRIEALGHARWAAPPADMIADLLRRDLTAWGRFRAVHGRRGSVPPDYELSGQVDALELLPASNPPTARLQLTVRLLRRRGDQVLLSRTYEERVEVKDRGAAGFAAAASTALQRVSQQLRADIERAVAADLARKAKAAASGDTAVPRQGSGS